LYGAVQFITVKGLRVYVASGAQTCVCYTVLHYQDLYHVSANPWPPPVCVMRSTTTF